MVQMLRAASRSASEWIVPVCILVIVVNMGLYYNITRSGSLQRVGVANIQSNTTSISTSTPKSNAHTARSVTSQKSELNSATDGQLASAFELFNYSKMPLMQPMATPRPLFKFTMLPWKIQANKSNFISANILEHHVNWSMIAMVKSHAEHASRREAVRKTWGSFKFLNGVRLEVIFLVGKGKTTTPQMNLSEENGKHGDILQIDMKEAYRDVGLKTLAGMQWVWQNFPPHWIYSSADDDMVPDLVPLYDDLEKLMSYSSNLVKTASEKTNEKAPGMFHPKIVSNLPIHCGFKLSMSARPMRGRCKWCVDNATYSLPSYPPYCHGGWYSMPVALASGIYAVSRQHEYFRLDDVWVTALLRLSYFNHEKIKTYLGLDEGDQGIGVWKVRHDVVRHAVNEKNVLNRWKVFEPRILKAAKEFIRI